MLISLDGVCFRIDGACVAIMSLGVNAGIDGQEQEKHPLKLAKIHLARLCKAAKSRWDILELSRSE